MAELEIKIPDRFAPADPADCVALRVEPEHVVRHNDSEETFRLGAMLLPSGQVIRWVAWAGGARFATVRPENDWAIEEHLDADPPEHLKTGVEWAWAMVVGAMVEANKLARRVEEAAGG